MAMFLATQKAKNTWDPIFLRLHLACVSDRDARHTASLPTDPCLLKNLLTLHVEMCYINPILIIKRETVFRFLRGLCITRSVT